MNVFNQIGWKSSIVQGSLATHSAIFVQVRYLREFDSAISATRRAAEMAQNRVSRDVRYTILRFYRTRVYLWTTCLN